SWFVSMCRYNVPMPRPREYTRARRVMMQVVMCLALGATVVMAWSVTKRHAAALHVELGSPKVFANSMLSIQARMPAGCRIAFEVTEGAAVIAANEVRTQLGLQRTLEIVLRRETVKEKDTPVEELAVNLKGRAPLGPARKLPILGTDGV